MVQDAVLWFDVSVEHTLLMEVHYCQQSLSEVVPGQGLWKIADSALYIYESAMFAFI